MEEPLTITEDLNKNITELSATVKKVNSLKFIFLRGILSGVGTFIGATVVAAIVVTILLQILAFLDIDLGIREYLTSLLTGAK